MRVLGQLISGVVVVCFTIAAGLHFGVPWDVPAELTRVFALLPLGVMASINFRQGSGMPSWLVFICGLAMDVMLQGFLGYWAFIYLTGIFLVQFSPFSSRRFLAGRLVALCGLGFGLFVAQFVLSWVTVLALPDWYEFALSTSAMTLFAGLLEVVLALFGSLMLRPGGLGSLARGM